MVWLQLHLVVDATYELPVGYSVTKAAESDVIEGHRMLKQLAENQPEIMEKAETLAADKAYDDTN